MGDVFDEMKNKIQDVMIAFAKGYLSEFIKRKLSSKVQGAIDLALPELQGLAKLAKGEKEEKKEKGYDSLPVIKVAKLASWAKKRDPVDLSEFTQYVIMSGLVAEEGSRLQTFNTQYRLIAAFHNDLAKELKKDAPLVAAALPPLPPGKCCGIGENDEEYQAARNKLLQEYFGILTKIPEVLNSKVGMQFFRLEEPNREPLEIFNMAITAVLAVEGLDSPDVADKLEEADDEGQALSIMMIQIVERSFLNRILDQVRSKMDGAPGSMIDKAVATTRQKVFSTVGTLVKGGWDAARNGVEAARKKLNEVFDKFDGPLTEGVNKVVGKVVAIASAKINERNAKKAAEGKEEPPKPEELDVSVKLESFQTARIMVNTVQVEKNRAKDAIDVCLEALKRQADTSNKVTKLMREAADWVPVGPVAEVVDNVVDSVRGVVGLVNQHAVSLATVVRPFFVVVDAVESKAAAGGKLADELAPLRDAMVEAVWVLNATINNSTKELNKNLRGVSSEATLDLKTLVQEIPESYVNFLAQWRARFESFVRKAQSPSAADIRRGFVATGRESLDDIFNDGFQGYGKSIGTMVKVTIVSKLVAPARPLILEGLEQIKALLPGAIADKIPADDLADKALTVLTDKTVDKAMQKATLMVQKRAMADD